VHQPFFHQAGLRSAEIVGFEEARVFRFIQQFFGRKTTEETFVDHSTTIKTAPLSEEQLQAVSKLEYKMTPPQLLVGTAQSVGIQRDHNEDTLFAMQAILADGVNDLPFGIFIVADGMGGHQSGEVASREAARSMSEYLMARFYGPFLAGESGSGESIQEIMEAGVKEAQRAVVRNAPGGGTTLTGALLLGEQVTLAHVGDSRAYFLFPDGRMQVMTQDHSLVRRLQDLGQIDEKEASVHPQRNVLYRALGQSEPFRPDINTNTMPRPGFMLMCSDGLWGTVSDDDIYRIVYAAANPSIACKELIEAANEAGGPDNITAILVQYLS
jgi:PPM family protein phosphatase